MRKNKGFTLIELLAVIIVLGVITVIAIPSVNKAIKKGKEQLYEVQIKNIELGAKSWAAENAFDLPEEDGQVVTLTLGQLKVAGFVELDVKNPVTETLFPNDMEVTITRQMNNFLYDVLEDSGTSTGDEDNIDLYSPTIILSGSASVYVEFGETYVEPGYTARNSSGVDITDQVTTEIKSNSTVIPSIDTTRFGQYKITYTVVDNERSASVIRTVTVEDTIAPELTIPSDITILDTEVATFDVMDGVSATDNSGEEVTITTSGNLSSIPGIYTITYTATDIKGNETVKTRTINVGSISYADYIMDEGVNKPKLFTGMTPVKWNGSSWINTTEDDSDWYNYTTTDKKWANAKTADGSMWVWIPRYVYKISSGWHASITGTVEVQFSMDTDDTRGGTINLNNDPSSSSSNNTWTTHPAFTFGNKELSGIWVAKFEATGSTSQIESKPSYTAITNQTISSMFEASRSMETNTVYGWDGTGAGLDTHLMKNTEWGAIAYLSKSNYGKENEEIWINPNLEYNVGCAGSNISASSTIGCNTYSTTSGVKASTTGNIYGVYDMSGGAVEYVAAYVDNGNSNLTSYGESIINANSRYKNVYPVTTDGASNNYNQSINIKGDAVYETSNDYFNTASWYSDESKMPLSTAPWFKRGGYYGGTTSAGIFNFANSTGAGISEGGFRPVLVEYNSPVVTFSNDTHVLVTSNVGLDQNSLKYYFVSGCCGPWDLTIPAESDFTNSFTNDTSISPPSSGVWRMWILAKDVEGNSTISLSDSFSNGTCPPCAP